MNLKSPNFLVASSARRKGISFFAPLLFCGLVTTTGFITSGAARAQSVDEILNAVRQSESKVQLRATQIVQRGGSREVATLYRSGPKRRLEWSAPAVQAGDVLVDDGQSVTLYHRAEKTAIQTQSPHRASALAPGGWKVGASTQLDGRGIRVLNRGKNRQLMIDAKTGVILRAKNAGGVTSLQNVQYGAVSPAKFQLALPAGVQIVRTQGRLFGDLNAARRFASWLRAPSQLPVGYTLESVVAGKSEVWLRYSNGKKRFSLFQQKTSDADLAPQQVNGGWFWRKNGLRFIATGAPADAIGSLSQ